MKIQLLILCSLMLFNFNVGYCDNFVMGIATGVAMQDDIRKNSDDLKLKIEICKAEPETKTVKECLLKVQKQQERIDFIKGLVVFFIVSISIVLLFVIFKGI
jgi:hypothetical protein